MSLTRTTNKILHQADLMSKLSDLAGRKNYPQKLKKLEAKIKEELCLWERKDVSPKLLDLRKDYNYVQEQINKTEIDKQRIDLLINKYSISYGKVNRDPI